MSIWRNLFGGTPKLEAVNATVPSTTSSTKLRIPKPSKIYVVGKSFLPTEDQQILGVEGFFYRHDNLEPHVPPGATWHGAMVFALSVEGFCAVAHSAVFNSLYGPHPGAYYLDAVILDPDGKHMMVFMIFEGNEAKAAKKQIPGGTNL